MTTTPVGSQMVRRSLRLVRELRFAGRCHDCLMFEPLFPARHLESGRRIFLCELCKIDNDVARRLMRA